MGGTQSTKNESYEKNDFCKNVEIKPEQKEDAIVSSLTDREPILVQKHDGKNKDRRLLQNDTESRIMITSEKEQLNCKNASIPKMKNYFKQKTL